MPVNDKIRVPDYNDIRNKVVNVLGTGSGNSGYGQSVRSSAVSESSRVTVNEWGNLRWDIINVWRHIYGSNPTIVLPAEGNTVRYDTDFAPSANMALEAPVTQYDTYANLLIANRFTVHPSQSATFAWTPTSTTWPGLYGNSWNSRIQCTITATWTTAERARHFFNSGGEIRFSASRTGGSSTTQNTSWTNILFSAGTQAFGAVKPNAGVDPNDGTNYFRCSSTYQVWYSISGSSPYGSNSYRISARTPSVLDNSNGTASTVEFLVEFIDNYVDPGVAPGSSFPFGTPSGAGTAGGGVQTATPADFPPDDAVDGTFTISASHLYSTGVLEPTGAGNFVVEQPTITLGAIAP